MMKTIFINSLIFTLIVAADISYAEPISNSSTEAGALCMDWSFCEEPHDPSLSRLTALAPLTASISQNSCPKFIIEQQILRDKKSSLTADSPDEVCSIESFVSRFKSADEFESYIQNNPFFSELNTKQGSTPFHFSSCLSQRISTPLDLGRTSLSRSTRTLPEDKQELAVAEYYYSLKRLADGAERSLDNITAIDLMMGEGGLLKDVPCRSFDAVSRGVKSQCSSIKQCSKGSSKGNSSENSVLEESAKDTLLALQGIEAIEREIRKLKGPRARNLSKNRKKIQELRERQKNIQSLYPWTLGKVFQDSYNQNDYINYAKSSEEVKSQMEVQMAGLIKGQLAHTRGKLKERKEDLLKATACIKGKDSFCEELDMDKILAHTPSINHEDVFERGRRKELKKKSEEQSLSAEEKKEWRRLLTKAGSADTLFDQVDCLQEQRKAVKEVNKELSFLALDTAIVIGTMGLGTAAVAGRLALRVGGAVSKAKKLTKAKRLQNLGVFGTDASFSAPYMKEAMNICEDKINQLEETANKEELGKKCERLAVGAKHTSDVKSCILQASLASLPITLPILGLSGLAIVKQLRGAKASSPAVSSSSATPNSPAVSSSATDKAEEVLGTKLSSSQKRAIEEAYLVGQGERGKNGALAGIGNYTEDQLRRKTEILKKAGFSKKQRRTLVEKGIVGDDLVRRAEVKLEQELQAIRNSPQESVLKEQGFKPTYYRGVDQAREFNAVAEYLRKIKADPKKTHIPYFSDQIDKTIADFEKGFRKHNQNKPRFLKERLKILEALKKEAQKRMKDENVTYDWWTDFNLRLAMIGPESDSVKKIHETINKQRIFNRFTDNPIERQKAGIEIAYNKRLAKELKRHLYIYPNRKKRLFRRLQKEFERLNPEDFAFKGAYTSQELERIFLKLDSHINVYPTKEHVLYDVMNKESLLLNDTPPKKYNMDTLKTHDGTQELLSDMRFIIPEAERNKISEAKINIVTDKTDIFIRLKEKFPEKIMFFSTDELGVIAFNKLEDNSHFVGVSGSPVPADGKTMDSLEFFTHDVDHIVDTQAVQGKTSLDIMERINNISSRSDREKAELALFMSRHENLYRDFSHKLKEYYTGVETNLSQSELRQLRTDARKAIKQSMHNRNDFFFNPDDLQGMLPDSVNSADKEKVRKFLMESADVFADILLAR